MICPNNRVISKWFKVHVFRYLYGFEPCNSRFAIIEVLRVFFLFKCHFFNSFCWMYVCVCVPMCTCMHIFSTNQGSSWYKWLTGSFALPNWTIGCKSFRTTSFIHSIISIVLERSWRGIISWVDYKRTVLIFFCNQNVLIPFLCRPLALVFWDKSLFPFQGNWKGQLYS